MKKFQAKTFAALLTMGLFSVPAKPLTQAQAGLISASTGVGVGIITAVLEYKLMMKYKVDDAAWIFASLLPLTTASIAFVSLLIQLEAHTPRGKLAKIAHDVKSLTFDPLLLGKFASPEAFLKYVSESFDKKWPLIAAHNHLEEMLVQISGMDKILRTIFINNPPIHHLLAKEWKGVLKKNLRIIQEIKTLMGYLCDHPDFCEQKKLYEVGLKQKAGMALENHAQI